MIRAVLLALLLAATAQARHPVCHPAHGGFSYVSNQGAAGAFITTVAPNGNSYSTFVPSPAFTPQPAAKPVEPAATPATVKQPYPLGNSVAPTLPVWIDNPWYVE